MARNHAKAADFAARNISASRAGRLFRLISLLAADGKSRPFLLKRLRLDLRSFYRDLEKLREFGVAVSVEGHHYRLTGSLDRAIARLPFPDPQLNLHEAMELAKGVTRAHRKLRSQIKRIIGSIPRR
jgi:hypothetical protein